ncbi:MAG TPA: TIGR04255 family protein [Acidimicrobiales bacterium]|nr:TIGR04255 family protein [Acidimicrobiales bacterium]
MAPSSTPPFANAPLVLTAAEVRFPEVDDISRRVEPVRELVRLLLPIRELMPTNNVQIGPDGIPSVTQTVTPRFVNRDHTTAMTVNPQAIVVETTAYDGYTEFRRLLEVCFEAAAAALSPDGVSRIGLRYIDEIRVPSVSELPGDWSGWIDERFIASVDRSLLEETHLRPKAWQGVVQYETAPDSTLVVRYGPAQGFAVLPAAPTRRLNPAEPGPYFLLDTDSFWEPSLQTPEFDAAGVLSRCDDLHTPTRKIFDAITTERLRTDVFEKERA